MLGVPARVGYPDGSAAAVCYLNEMLFMYTTSPVCQDQSARKDWAFNPGTNRPGVASGTSE
jgi:hypothetical protein